MASPLVPTILSFNHAEVPTWAESQSRPQSMPLGSVRSFRMPETRGGLEPSEPSLNALVRLTVEDPGDHGEFKLPKMRSLVIMLFTNVLLQVSSLCSGMTSHTLTSTCSTCLRRRFSSLSPLVVNTLNIWVAVRRFPVWLSVFRPLCLG